MALARGQSQRDLSAKRAIEAHLATYVDGQKPALHVVMGPIRELLRTERTMTYTLAPRGDGVTMESWAGDGWHVALAAHTFDEFFRDQPAVRWVGFNPLRPEPAQRNTVMTLEDMGPATLESPGYHYLYPKIGLAGTSQLRVLVCHGPSLLGWVGGFQTEPCAQDQRRLLRDLVPALKRRLLLEHTLQRAPLFDGALESALEAIGRPAFLVSETGSIARMNVSGARCHAEDARTLLSALRECVRRPERASRFEVTRVAAAGCPPHFLVIAHAEPAAESGARAAAASARWGLTKRQGEVLALIATGLTNRVIAATLGVAQTTVEVHLTAIFDKAQVENRAELVARVWGG